MFRSIRRGVVTHLGFFGIVAAIASVWSFLLSRQPPANISSGVLAWWTGLCLVSAFNIWVWRQCAAALAQRADRFSPEYVFERRQLVLSAVYVLGCAFRAILPRADVQRLGLLDSWVSSVMVGRTVATVAELCFAAQWALLLHHVARNANGGRLATAVSWLLVPLVGVAEIFSWYGVLTTAYIGNAIEESIWALSAMLLIVSFLTLGCRCRPGLRPLWAAALVCGLCYVAFMCTVDIPMYVSRWLEDEASGRQYLSLGQGIGDVGSRWVVTFAWDQWHPEIPWMSLYFSVGVWCSLALARVPWFARNPGPS